MKKIIIALNLFCNPVEIGWININGTNCKQRQLIQRYEYLDNPSIMEKLGTTNDFGKYMQNLWNNIQQIGIIDGFNDYEIYVYVPYTYNGEDTEFINLLPFKNNAKAVIDKDLENIEGNSFIEKILAFAQNDSAKVDESDISYSSHCHYDSDFDYDTWRLDFTLRDLSY